MWWCELPWELWSQDVGKIFTRQLYQQSYTEIFLSMCCLNLIFKFVYYLQVIFGDKSSLTETVFFIRKGKCDMIKSVKLIRTQSPYLRPSLFLPSPKTEETSKKFMNKSYGKTMRISRTENHLLTVMSLYPGDFFGAGLINWF